ncbi:MAG: hypothetical protein Q7J75_02740 [Rhodoferax sp.]|nr:hypothetical protein [Rhodoferax sp.]
MFQLTSEQAPEKAVKTRDRLAANTEGFMEPLDKLEALAYLPKGQALVAKAKASAAQYVTAYGKVLVLLDQGQKDEAAKAAFGETYAALHVLANDLRAFNDFQQEIVEASGEQSHKTFEATRLQMIIVGMLALLLGMVSAWLITQGLLQQLGVSRMPLWPLRRKLPKATLRSRSTPGRRTLQACCSRSRPCATAWPASSARCARAPTPSSAPPAHATKRVTGGGNRILRPCPARQGGPFVPGGWHLQVRRGDCNQAKQAPERSTFDSYSCTLNVGYIRKSLQIL